MPENGVIESPAKRRWLPWAIVGGVGLVIFVISLGPINRMCRGMVHATKLLPDTISVGSCSTKFSPDFRYRTFTAQTSLAEAQGFLAAHELPIDPTKTATAFTMSWKRVGEEIQIGWQDGTLRYEQTLSGSLN